MKDELEDQVKNAKSILSTVLGKCYNYSPLELRLLTDEIRGLRHELLSIYDYNFTYRLFALLLVESETQAMLAENILRFGNLSQISINLKRVIALLEVEIEELNNKENGK